MIPQGHYHDASDDDEEETVELRVSASRQNGKQTMLRRMSSSTSSRMPDLVQSETIQERCDRRSSTTGILDFTKSVLSAATSQRPYGITAEEAVSPEAAQLLPNTTTNNTWKQESYGFEQSPSDSAKENQARLKLMAFWQLLLTGFEVLTFSIGKRAKKHVMWLALDGNLYVGSTKKDKKTARCIFLADMYRIQKGNGVQSFTKSQSWRDARGKDNLTFSIHGRHNKEDRIFAIQVWKATVRNVLFENFETLLRMMKSDADGEFPYVAQRVIAEHYAMAGEVLTLRQVEDVLLREEDEKKPRELGGNGSDGEGRSSGESDLSEQDEDQSDILG